MVDLTVEPSRTSVISRSIILSNILQVTRGGFSALDIQVTRVDQYDRFAQLHRPFTGMQIPNLKCKSRNEGVKERNIRVVRRGGRVSNTVKTLEQGAKQMNTINSYFSKFGVSLLQHLFPLN